MLLLRRSHRPGRLIKAPLVALSLMTLCATAVPVDAGALPTYRLSLADGRLEPVELEVVAGQRFKIELHNAGSTPVEFESRRLRQEKVMGPGVHSFVVVHPLKPGRYDYFDEFHLPEAQGVIIARDASEVAQP